MSQPQGVPPSPPPGTSVSSIGAEHALLTYLYLDRGDVDGYASLVDGDARFEHPGFPVAHGAEAAAALALRCCGSGGSHRPQRVITAERDVIVTGELVLQDTETEERSSEEFADLFAITEHGLLASWRRFRRRTD
ncbi:nuclear transport factor 2 family protein [Nocardiopsis lucentensis]|uniref:nuclear transport factor 2 family protein n=1 Tax=Nocardiopsis lucentensis TaxID=53441 RepID=UPI00034DEDC5|nr:nuclear transport factor 2 family protein [Nocardiopsis lucentensis]